MPEPTSPILVTGAHRTGTTWVGKMLAAAPRTAYISEPLNVHHRPGVLAAPVTRWYTYIHPGNEAEYLPALRRMLAFRYGWPAEIAAVRSRKDVLRMGRDGAIFLSGWAGHKRPLLKDPFAVFSAAWFAERLGCRVVVTVRHPAAFASSLKRLAWPFDFSDLLAQDALMHAWLEPYRAAMTAALAAPDDVIGQAGLLWCMTYDVVRQLQTQVPGLLVTRHEDLSRDPVGGYRALYADLGLEFTAAAERTILSASSGENPGELARGQTHGTRLDSRANLHNWQRRLAAAEIDRLRDLTAAAAAPFYPDWDTP
jgi:hypothetical protein